jgi:hypothetical protein
MLSLIPINDKKYGSSDFYYKMMQKCCLPFYKNVPLYADVYNVSKWLGNYNSFNCDRSSDMGKVLQLFSFDNKFKEIFKHHMGYEFKFESPTHINKLIIDENTNNFISNLLNQNYTKNDPFKKTAYNQIVNDLKKFISCYTDRFHEKNSHIIKYYLHHITDVHINMINFLDSIDFDEIIEGYMICSSGQNSTLLYDYGSYFKMIITTNISDFVVINLCKNYSTPIMVKFINSKGDIKIMCEKNNVESSHDFGPYGTPDKILTITISNKDQFYSAQNHIHKMYKTTLLKINKNKQTICIEINNGFVKCITENSATKQVLFASEFFTFDIFNRAKTTNFTYGRVWIMLKPNELLLREIIVDTKRMVALINTVIGTIYFFDYNDKFSNTNELLRLVLNTSLFLKTKCTYCGHINIGDTKLNDGSNIHLLRREHIDWTFYSHKQSTINNYIDSYEIHASNNTLYVKGFTNNKSIFKIFDNFNAENIKNFVPTTTTILRSNNNNIQIEQYGSLNKPHIIKLLNYYSHYYTYNLYHDKLYLNGFSYTNIYYKTTITNNCLNIYTCANKKNQTILFDDLNDLLDSTENSENNIKMNAFINEIIVSINQNNNIIKFDHADLLHKFNQLQNCLDIYTINLKECNDVDLDNLDSNYWYCSIKDKNLYLILDQLFVSNNEEIKILVEKDTKLLDNPIHTNLNNIHPIWNTFILAKDYDIDHEYCTIHDLGKLDKHEFDEFEMTFSSHLLGNKTEVGKVNFKEIVQLDKEEVYQAHFIIEGSDILIFNRPNDHFNLAHFNDNNYQDSYLIIVCGLGDIINWLTGTGTNSSNSNSSVTKHTNNNGRSTVHHNNKLVYEENKGVIVKNEMKIGQLKEFPRIVYKEANIKGTQNRCIVKLRLPDDAKFSRSYNSNNWRRSHLYSGKRRCSKAIVEEILEYNFDHEIPIPNAVAESSISDKKLIYRVGEIVYPDSFDSSNAECSNGIHVFEKLSHIKSLSDKNPPPSEIINEIMPESSFNKPINKSLEIEAKQKAIINEINKKTEEVEKISTSTTEIDELIKHLLKELDEINQEIIELENNITNGNNNNNISTADDVDEIDDEEVPLLVHLPVATAIISSNVPILYPVNKNDELIFVEPLISTLTNRKNKKRE